jgi:hypothetical protein
MRFISVFCSCKLEFYYAHLSVSQKARRKVWFLYLRRDWGGGGGGLSNNYTNEWWIMTNDKWQWDALIFVRIQYCTTVQVYFTLFIRYQYWLLARCCFIDRLIDTWKWERTDLNGKLAEIWAAQSSLVAWLCLIFVQNHRWVLCVPSSHFMFFHNFPRLLLDQNHSFLAVKSLLAYFSFIDKRTGTKVVTVKHSDNKMSFVFLQCPVSKARGKQTKVSCVWGRGDLGNMAKYPPLAVSKALLNYVTVDYCRLCFRVRRGKMIV